MCTFLFWCGVLCDMGHVQCMICEISLLPQYIWYHVMISTRPKCELVNSLWQSDAKWHQWTGHHESIWWLVASSAPSHNWNQYKLQIGLWETNVTEIWIKLQKLHIEASTKWLTFCRWLFEMHFPVRIFTRGQFWPSGIVVACVCVCVSVCLSVCQSLAFPRDNSGPVQARIAKFGPKMQKTLVKVPIVLGANWPWPSRSNLT